MKKQSQSLLSLLIVLALVLISCRLLTPAHAPGADVEQSVAQTVAAQLVDEIEDTQPLETPEPSAMMIDEDAAQPEGMGPCQLVFVSEQGGVWDLLALDFNTRQLWQLTSHGDVDTQVGFQADPTTINVSVSPDGALIAFNSDEKVTQAVYVIHRDGINRQSIGFNITSNDSWPTWSPDGDLLAFESDRDGELQVYIMDLAGELREHSIEASEAFIYPAWSPTGAQIAMVSGAGQDLYLYDIDSGQLTRLTEDVLVYGPPAWSPDGERLVVSADEGGLWNIYVIETATGALTQLTEGSDVNRFPAWSPDGEWIAFSSERDGQAGIYLMPAEGGEVIRLTDHDRQDLAKAWLPGCAEELPGLLAGWDRDAPLVAGDPVPAIPGPGEADPVDPPTDDPADPPADDPVDPPADDPFDPPAEDEATTPEVTGNPIIDVVLDWARRIGQRVGLIPIGEGEQISTVWDDLLGLLDRSGDDPVGMGTGQELTATVTPEATATLEVTPDITPTPADLDPWYFVYPMALPGWVMVYGINCSGFEGTWHIYWDDSVLNYDIDLPSDPGEYPVVVDYVSPSIYVQVTMPERPEPGSCSSVTDCDWESEPFEFNYVAYQELFNGSFSRDTVSAQTMRMIVGAYEPGVSARIFFYTPRMTGVNEVYHPPNRLPESHTVLEYDELYSTETFPLFFYSYHVVGPQSRQRAFELITRFCD